MRLLPLLKYTGSLLHLQKKKIHQGQTSKRCVSKVEERLNSLWIYQPTITNFCDNILGIMIRCSHLLCPTTRGKPNEEFIKILNVSMGPVKPHFKGIHKVKIMVPIGALEVSVSTLSKMAAVQRQLSKI